MHDDVKHLAGVSQHMVHGWLDGRAQTRPDWLAQEVPIAMVFNGISHAVMMASPADLEDFALGFALSEGLVTSASEVYGIEVHEVCDGTEVQLTISAACEWRLKERRRTLSGKTGCGLCGTDSLSEVQRTLAPVQAVQLTAAAVSRAMGLLRDTQAMQQLTGATHAAAYCHASGDVTLLREDVGRHNALDKLIGALVKAGVDTQSGFIAITSRASFEMVQKAMVAGVGALVAVSAPTALAVDTAARGNLALAGFARSHDFVAYTHPDRFGLSLPQATHRID
jgi:FdhD protein